MYIGMHLKGQCISESSGVDCWTFWFYALNKFQIEWRFLLPSSSIAEETERGFFYKKSFSFLQFIQEMYDNILKC